MADYVYVDPEETFEMSTDNEYWIGRILEDAQKHPDEIEVLLMPEANNGSIKVRIPYKYMDIRPEQIRFDGSEGETSNGKS